MTQRVEISCPVGTVVGYESDGVRHFHSIPYSHIAGPFAKATKLTPEAVAADAVFDAREPRPEAIALTITTPADAPVAGAPVIVYVHGGRYEHGTHEDPRAEGTATARAGVVHVQVDYRVKLPGLAKLEDDDYFFYRGIHDVMVGLEWVQDNIEAFGGDPTNVTLVGQSAGATTALWLARRDHYRGAFRRVVAMSPCYPRQSFEERKAHLPRGWEGMDDPGLEKAYGALRKKIRTDMALGPYPLIPEDLADIPIVLTSTREEFYGDPATARLDRTPARKVLAWWGAPSFDMRRENFSAWLDLSGAQDRPIGKMVGDSCCRRWVEQVARQAPGPTWMLEFIRSSRPALHSKDIRFLFGNAYPDADTGEAPVAAHEWLLHYARTGEPDIPAYGAEHAVTVFNLETGERQLKHGALDYLVQAFGED